MKIGIFVQIVVFQEKTRDMLNSQILHYLMSYNQIFLNLLIHVNNIIDKNTKSKFLKTVEDDVAYKLIVKMID